MDNKIILELVAKNLEEIKLLVEALRNGEKADPLLIEITATKAKTLYQELMLLSPAMPESSEKEQPIIIDEFTAEDSDSQVTTPLEPIIDDKPDEVSDIQETTPIVTLIENEPQSISEIETNTFEVHEITIAEAEMVINIPEPTEEPVLINKIEPEPTQPIENIPESKLHEEKLEEPKTEIHEKKIIGEQFINEPLLHEKLAASNMHESKIKGKPVTHIMNAIGLNDRFLFTRELFANDSKNFETTVDQLDRLKSFLEAIDFLEANFKWTKNEASLKFMELLKRRFES